jgi:hypothetical protein
MEACGWTPVSDEYIEITFVQLIMPFALEVESEAATLKPHAFTNVMRYIPHCNRSVLSMRSLY